MRAYHHFGVDVRQDKDPVGEIFCSKRSPREASETGLHDDADAEMLFLFASPRRIRDAVFTRELLD